MSNNNDYVKDYIEKSQQKMKRYIEKSEKYKPTKKEAFFEWMWVCIFSVFALASLGLSEFGLYCLLEDNAFIPGLALFFVFPCSIAKMKEKKARELLTRIKIELEEPEYECVDWAKKYELTKIIEKELK